MGKLATFFRISGGERRLFLEAVFWCGLVRMMMLVLPFRKYVKLLGKPRKEEERKSGRAEERKKEEERNILAIGTAVERASRNVPWKTRCLVEAAAAKRMLKRRGLESIAYLGVAKKKNDLIAHAWLTCDDVVVTGKKGVKKYTTVSTFV